MALANEVDIERLCATMKVMAFDLDGTLARSKKTKCTSPWLMHCRS